MKFKIKKRSKFVAFSGAHCEHNRNECDLLHKCSQEGTELCEDLINDYKCNCRHGYTGELCEIHIDQVIMIITFFNFSSFFKVKLSNFNI